MVGMPRGRCSVVPGLGIQTRRVGRALVGSVKRAASASRWAGVRSFTPSTPAVRLPRLSWETRRTASSLADRDLTKRRWSLRTAFSSPRRLARSMRVWSLNTVRWYCRQGSVFHSSTGDFAVLMTCALRLVPLPSRPACLRQLIPRLSRGRSLLRQSCRRVHAAGACSVYRPPRRGARRLSRSCDPCCATVGPYYPPEPAESNAGTETCPRPRLVPVWAGLLLHVGQMHDNDGSAVRSLALSVVACYRHGPVGVGREPDFSPLHGLMASRYRGGNAVPRLPRGPGITPGIGPQVVWESAPS